MTIPAMTTIRELAAVMLLFSLAPMGCRSRMTEEEALQEAREEVRREMQPEVDRRRKEIEELKRRIAEAKARIEAQKAARSEEPNR
jgi:outer membrane protein TolC